MSAVGISAFAAKGAEFTKHPEKLGEREEIKSLKIEPTKLSIECEGAKQVIVHLGGRKTLQAFGNKENPLTEASFDITDDYKYIRVTVVDFEGKCADTRAFFTDEIG